MRIVRLLSVAALLAALSVVESQAQTHLERTATQLRESIVRAGSPPRLVVEGETVHSSVVLPAFYRQRAYRPAWTTAQGLSPQADSLVGQLRDARAEGLRADDYHLARLDRMMRFMRAATSLGREPDARELAALDLLLTDAYLIYGAHLVSGRLDPVTIQSGWHAVRREVDLAASLRSALETGTVAASLRALRPAHPGYFTLRDALARYRAIAERGGWRPIPPGPIVRPGDRDSRMGLLRARLVDAGDLAAADAKDPDRYDAELAAAVRRYQERHGLEPDAAIGPATRAELNTTVEERIARLEVNMERWRWLPQRLGERHILVNIAAFQMTVMEGERSVLSMRAVVGRPYRMTPVFSERMTHFVLSPTWTVPPRLAVEDKLPLIRRNPNYLRQQGMRVLRPGTEREVDPATIDWSRLTASNFPFVLRQDPGPLNALGRVKFMFPNPFNVYLHDTPAQEHFPLASRAFSSGCIRLERPMDLAHYLSRDLPSWTPERIDAASRGRTESTVRLPRPVAVHLLYWTAWADADGTIHFRPDIYSRDERVAAELRRGAPATTMGDA